MAPSGAVVRPLAAAPRLLPLGGPDPLVRLQALMAEIDEVLLIEIAERRAEVDGAPAGDDICSLLVAARFDDTRPSHVPQLTWPLRRCGQ